MALPKISQPVFEMTIPSNKKKIKYRPMLVKDEKILLIAKQSKERSDIMTAIKQVVNNCIITENVNIDDLAIFDIEYMFIKLRAASISNISKVSYQDVEDEKVYDFDIDLNALDVKMNENVNNKITVSKNLILELRWPPASLYSSKTLYDATDETMFDIMVSASMSKLYEGDTVHDMKLTTPEERSEFIGDLPAKAAEQIREFFSNIPTIYHEINYKNSKGTERKIVLNTLDDFFTL